MDDLLIIFFRKWVAGDHLEDALRKASGENETGVKAIINFLGEHYDDKKNVDLARAMYVRAVSEIKQKKINSAISVKPSQLGLCISREFCQQVLDEVIDQAKKSGIFVWIDMESYRFFKDTLQIFEGLRKKFDNLGITLQANIRESLDNAKRISKSGGIIRLVRGAYKEKSDVAYSSADAIEKSFEKIMAFLFSQNNYFAIASHDYCTLKEAVRLSRKFSRDFEFQVLMGINDELMMTLAKKYKVAEYIPFGHDWLKYVFRRLKEERKDIFLLVKKLAQSVEHGF